VRRILYGFVEPFPAPGPGLHYLIYDPWRRACAIPQIAILDFVLFSGELLYFNPMVSMEVSAIDGSMSQSSMEA
jgi:hypothetical protein